MKKQMYSKLVLLVVTVLFFTCSSDDDNSISTEEKTISEILNEENSLSVINALIKAVDTETGSDLEGTLNTDGPFTFFAPINESDSPLVLNIDNNGTINLTPEDAALWRQILTYHVIPNRALSASDLQNEDELATVLGPTQTIEINFDGELSLEDATSESAAITRANVLAENGIVHFINKVLIPSSVISMLPGSETSGDTRNMPARFQDYPSLSTLVMAIEKANLSFEYPADNFTQPALNISTYFAPDNAAFTAMFDFLGDSYSSLDDFDTTEELEVLKDILLYQHSSSYLCSEALVDVGNSSIFASRLINPQVPQFPDNRIEALTIGDASNPVITLKDRLNREARINEADIPVGLGQPSCAEGLTNPISNTTTGLIHITDNVLLKQDFVDRLNN